MHNLHTTYPHFVRCIIPNEIKTAGNVTALRLTPFTGLFYPYLVQPNCTTRKYTTTWQRSAAWLAMQNQLTTRQWIPHFCRDNPQSFPYPSVKLFIGCCESLISSCYTKPFPKLKTSSKSSSIWQHRLEKVKRLCSTPFKSITTNTPCPHHHKLEVTSSGEWNKNIYFFFLAFPPHIFVFFHLSNLSVTSISWIRNPEPSTAVRRHHRPTPQGVIPPDPSWDVRWRTCYRIGISKIILFNRCLVLFPSLSRNLCSVWCTTCTAHTPTSCAASFPMKSRQQVYSVWLFLFLVVSSVAEPVFSLSTTRCSTVRYSSLVFDTSIRLISLSSCTCQLL